MSIKLQGLECFQFCFSCRDLFDSSVMNLLFFLGSLPPGSWSYFGWSDQQSTYGGSLFFLPLIILFVAFVLTFLYYFTLFYPSVEVCYVTFEVLFVCTRHFFVFLPLEDCSSFVIGLLPQEGAIYSNITS